MGYIVKIQEEKVKKLNVDYPARIEITNVEVDCISSLDNYGGQILIRDAKVGNIITDDSMRVISLGNNSEVECIRIFPSHSPYKLAGELEHGTDILMDWKQKSEPLNQEIKLLDICGRVTLISVGRNTVKKKIDGSSIIHRLEIRENGNVGKIAVRLGGVINHIRLSDKAYVGHIEVYNYKSQDIPVVELRDNSRVDIAGFQKTYKIHLKDCACMGPLYPGKDSEVIIEKGARIHDLEVEEDLRKLIVDGEIKKMWVSPDATIEHFEGNPKLTGKKKEYEILGKVPEALERLISQL